MEKRKILFIIEDLEVGGAERLFVKLIQNISSDAYEVRVVCINHKGIWGNELENRGIEVVSMGKKPGLDFRILFRLVSFMRKERPDLVNTHLWTADFWGRIAAVLSGVNHIVVTLQNVDIWKRWYHKRIDLFLSRWTEYFICVSNEVVKFYHENFDIPLAKIRMIPNAIDLDLFDKQNTQVGLRKIVGASADDFIFTCAARLHPQKAHHILIKASKILTEKGLSNFHVILAGDGELRHDLERMVLAYGLSEKIHFLGIRQDIADILIQSDTFVLSSDYEGLPLSILEAMAARLPIIATRVGGNPQVITERENGFLVPPGNPEAFAEAMGKMMENKVMAKKMGQVGRRIVEAEYNITIITDRTLKVFETCLVSHE